MSTRGRPGTLRKRVTVTSNDPKTPRLVLTLEGEVITDVMVSPRWLRLPQVGKGETASAEFSVKVSEPEKFEVQSVEIEDRRFAIEPLHLDATDGARYRLRFLGSDELGRLSSKVEIHYSGPSPSSVSLPVHVVVASDLRYRKFLRFVQRNGAFAPQEVSFSRRSGKPVAIRSVRDSKKQLKLTIVQRRGKRAVFRAQVAAPNAPRPRGARGNVRIRTDHPDEPTVDIPYTITDSSPKAARQPSVTPRPPMSRDVPSSRPR